MVRDWLTKKASKTIEAAVEPTKKAIQKTIEQKSDWASKLLKLGLLTFLTIVAFGDKAMSDSGDRPAGVIPNIVINNYIRDERSKEE